MGFQFFIQFLGQGVLLARSLLLPVGRAEGVDFSGWNKRIPGTAGSNEHKKKRGADPNNFFIDEVINPQGKIIAKQFTITRDGTFFTNQKNELYHFEIHL